MKNKFSTHLILPLQVWGIPARTFLVILLWTLLAYWPLTSCLFALKNDAINYFWPVRYSIVASIRSGHLPYWSPYIYMGYPLNADLQSGAFNPLLWFFSLLGNYSFYMLHVETWCYIFIACLGSYKLLQLAGLRKEVVLLLACMYPLIGFFTDSGQNIAWLANAAFLPFAYYTFIKNWQNPSLANTIKLALAMFMLLTVGYPAFFIYCCYLFFIWIIWYLAASLLAKKFSFSRSRFKLMGLAAILFLSFSLSPILHYIDFLPYYQRGGGLSYNYAMTNSLPPSSLISILFPWTIHAADFHSQADASVLNCYFGFLLVPFVFIGLHWGKNKRAHSFIVFIILFSLLFSLGKWTPIRGWTYHWLPFMDSFRHPANFRLFFSQGLLFMAGMGLNAWLNEENTVTKMLTRYFLPGIIITLFVLTVMYWPGITAIKAQVTKSLDLAPSDLIQQIKFDERIFIAAVIQLLFSITFLWIIAKRKKTFVFSLIMLNILFFQQIDLFTNFVSSSSVSFVQKHFRFRTNFPLPDLASDTLATDGQSPFAQYPPDLKYIFRQQVVIQTYFTNPTYFKSYSDFANNKNMVEIYKHYPVIFYTSEGYITGSDRTISTKSDSTMPSMEPAGIHVLKFGPNRILIETNAGKNGQICIFQNKFRYWKAKLDGEQVKIAAFANSFMAVNVEKGKHLLELYIDSGWKKWTYLWTLLMLLLSGFYLIFSKKSNHEQASC